MRSIGALIVTLGLIATATPIQPVAARQMWFTFSSASATSPPGRVSRAKRAKARERRAWFKPKVRPDIGVWVGIGF